jgi:molecular chaperone GrpE
VSMAGDDRDSTLTAQQREQADALSEQIAAGVGHEDSSRPTPAQTDTDSPQQSDEQGTDEAALADDVDELVAVGAQRDEYLALAQRTQADFENYRKRMARESSLAQQRGVAKLAKELLPALDNLDRALEAADQDDPLLEGVRLVRSELASSLSRVGIESFSPVGETFDPAEHEAMAQQPVDDMQSGQIVEVYQPGYRLGSNIIRAARVLVAS